MDANSKMASANLGNTASGYGQGSPYQSLYNNQLQSVTVTQATSSVVRTAPSTTPALVLNTLGAIFCGFFCGSVGIIMAWKARMHAIKKRYEEANHTLSISWVFFLLSFLFGILIWGWVGYFIRIVTAPYNTGRY